MESGDFVVGQISYNSEWEENCERQIRKDAERSDGDIFKSLPLHFPEGTQKPQKPLSTSLRATSRTTDLTKARQEF
jgi:hypothetical protein